MAGETANAEAAWRAAVAKILGAGPETLISRTLDGIEVAPLYPAFKGVDCPSGRPAGRWRIAQRIDHPDPAEARAQLAADLEGGADSFTLVAAGAAGSRGFGLELQGAGELESLLADLPIGAVELRLDPDAGGLDLARWAFAAAERRESSLAGLDLGVDPVGILVSTGALPSSWPEIGAEMAEALGGFQARGFGGRLFRADGRIWAEAGGSDAQELAAVLATAVAYLRSLEAGGIDLDAARSSISFALSADTEIASTVAKFRAMRRLWARVEEACGLSPRPLSLHGETAWRMLSARSPYTNIVRGTVACFAAALGGADAITVLPFTAALGLPDAFARRIARNTQHVLAEEAQLWRVADPAAGAGLFEALTRSLGETAWSAFQEIEREGGVVESLAAGHVQRRISLLRAEREARLAGGRDVLVGANRFRHDDAVPPSVLRPMRPAVVSVGIGPLRAEPLAPLRLAQGFEDPSGPGVRTEP